LFSHRERVVALTARHVLPTIFSNRDAAVAGGLMSYGPNVNDAFHQVGLYTGRILKGEKPADLPVQQATKVEPYINLKTAKALGVTFSDNLLSRLR
jgi:putative ABC transport system substrate-binding protein